MDNEKQKLIEQAQQIAEKGCEKPPIVCESCVLSNNGCDGADPFFSDTAAKIFLAGIAFEKGEVKEKIKNPCIECGEEWVSVHSDKCPHCGNVLPF